jgi:thiol-disulfide isomerase/thioredoxin
MVQLMENAGIDLKDADIKIISATLASGQSPRGAGTLDNLMGTQFKLALSVSSAGHAKNGAALSGDYVLAVKQLTRFEGNWKIEQDVHWEKLPDGVVDAKTSASMEFENYVAQYGTLPRGTVAPEIEFTTLDGGKNMKLSDLRGKVVILDFWATWCGPCQQPMAELQKLRQNHADWQDQVAIVPLSIDDTMGIVSKHIAQRGWTNTFNVWAGDGGWHSLPAQTFRVTGVPTSYVIDQKGTIVWAGHPAGANFGETVDALLKNK